MTTLILRAALVAVLVYALLVLALFLAQRSLQYPVQTRQATAAEAGLADFRDVALATPDGERLVAWWKPPQPGRTLVLYLHGNASSLWGLRERMRALGATGRGVLVVAYRGYSGSTGSPTEEGLRHDARTAYEWA
ncbi:MAG TPA: alpha/beta hydrolase, partial [Microvirga sp.]|nr:alpha/beta hydrolase [Microvirga sp.]